MGYYLAKLRNRAASYLEVGESIHHVIPAIKSTGVNPSIGLILLGLSVGIGLLSTLNLLSALLSLVGLAMLSTDERLIVVTNQSVLVLRRWRSVWREKVALLARLPRGTRIGPVSGLFAKISLNGEQMFVARQFHSDVRAADAAVGYLPPSASGLADRLRGSFAALTAAHAAEWFVIFSYSFATLTAVFRYFASGNFCASTADCIGHLVTVAVYLALAYGIYRRSRICASYFLFDYVSGLSNLAPDDPTSIIRVAIAILLLLGVIGTFVHHSRKVSATITEAGKVTAPAPALRLRSAGDVDQVEFPSERHLWVPIVLLLTFVVVANETYSFLIALAATAVLGGLIMAWFMR
jgi:hypothetical protein